MKNETPIPKNLKELIEYQYLYPCWLAEKNDYLLNEAGKQKRKEILEKRQKDNLPRDLGYLDLSKLDALEGYFVFLTKEDYAALSPLLFNSIAEKLNINVRTIYFVGNPEDAKIVVDGLKQDPKYLGGGFGSGWKEQFQYLDEIHPEDADSINSIIKDKNTGKLIGYNTDIEGFLLPLEKKLKELNNSGFENKTYIIFGAGGVGKSLVKEIARRDASKIYLVNRTLEKAVKLAEEVNREKEIIMPVSESEFAEKFLENASEYGKMDVVINTTKKGAGDLEDYAAFAPVTNVEENNKKSLEVAKKLAEINPDIIIYDIALSKSELSKTLEIAKNAGIKNILGGENMFLNQAICVFKNLEKHNPVFGKLEEEFIKETFYQVIKK